MLYNSFILLFSSFFLHASNKFYLERFDFNVHRIKLSTVYNYKKYFKCGPCKSYSPIKTNNANLAKHDLRISEKKLYSLENIKRMLYRQIYADIYLHFYEEFNNQMTELLSEEVIQNDHLLMKKIEKADHREKQIFFPKYKQHSAILSITNNIFLGKHFNFSEHFMKMLNMNVYQFLILSNLFMPKLSTIQIIIYLKESEIFLKRITIEESVEILLKIFDGNVQYIGLASFLVNCYIKNKNSEMNSYILFYKILSNMKSNIFDLDYENYELLFYFYNKYGECFIKRNISKNLRKLYKFEAKRQICSIYEAEQKLEDISLRDFYNTFIID